ncbi:ABC transporter permease [Aliifodinibius sp. S!AR15-10]|uniref:ABC transporter permease n=1 Tax=Aliifodinibius sp. S!AR15-10 TaxID=2950437 RepID=UPI0028608CC9|nr:ABC transporter permease [Aliifodinibius sp. S!AR15-10]MDR8393445.1 ABC transporter permease [Aliifodinibius sp. S!AR15-10]
MLSPLCLRLKGEVMLKNYIKIAFRNLLKERGYAFINITGLAVGLATCIIILLYVTHELSYDEYNEKSDRIFRIATDFEFEDNSFEIATVPTQMGPTLERDFPEVERAVRFRDRGSFLVRSTESNSNRREEDIIYVDAGFFDLFTLPMIYGNPETALTDPYTVVITASAAERHFGTPDAVGKTLILSDEDTYTITGIIEDIPEASHFHYDFLLSMKGLEGASEQNWWSFNFHTYLLLREGTDPEAFEEKFESFKKNYMETQLKGFLDLDFDQFESAGNKLEYYLQPLTDIHLYSDLDEELEANSSILYVYIFSGLALFILILACINFMNLATARSSNRAKEVGIRKTLGSLRKQLTVQFLAESLMLSFIAFFVALLFVEMSLPFFSKIAGLTFTSNYLSEPLLIVAVIGIVIITGLLAGSYPAMMLSSMKPVTVLKGVYKEGKSHSLFRKGLVVFQFSLSIIILVGLLVINRQLDFIQSKDLGFEKGQVLILNDAWVLGDAYRLKTFRDEMLAHTVFEDGTVTGHFPVEGYGISNTAFWPEGREPSGGSTITMENWVVDKHYIPTLGMEIIEGRNFSEELDAQKNPVILNESAVRRLGIDDPVGEVIYAFGDDPSDSEAYRSFTIVGMVRDFHFRSLRQNIAPIGLFYGVNRSNIAFRVSPGNESQALDLLRSTWSDYAPMQPFSYEFMDQQFDRMYRSENRIQDLMTSFLILAGLIACLGLFGLTAYAAQQRTKEIGIRKVFGATVTNIIGMLSKDFIKLVMIGFLIAIPIAWYAMNRWLQDFAYRIEIGPWIFAIAGGTALLIALATVSWQSVKAGLMNPVNSLRSE